MQSMAGGGQLEINLSLSITIFKFLSTNFVITIQILKLTN